MGISDAVERRKFKNPTKQYPFFKTPYTDDNGIFHWYAYFSDEIFQIEGLPLEAWIEESNSVFSSYTQQLKLNVTEPVVLHTYLELYKFHEIHVKAGVIE